MATIAVDWDGTFNLISDLLLSFMEAARYAGHTVIICTMRYESEKAEMSNVEELFKIYFTGRKAKKPFLDELGIKVDIWIDDNPQWVNSDIENPFKEGEYKKQWV